MSIRDNNKGVTLIEIIIVIAIMAVLSTVAGLSLYIVNSANTNKSANALKSLIDKTRNEAMAYGNATMTISSTGNGTSVVVKTSSGKELCNEIIAADFLDAYMYYSTSATMTPVDISGAMNGSLTNISISFNSVGSVNSIVVDGELKDDVNARLIEVGFKRGKHFDGAVVYPVTGKAEVFSNIE